MKEENKLVITVQPIERVSPKSVEAAGFIKDVKDAAFIEFDQKELEAAEIQDLSPEDFSSGQFNTSLDLYSLGVSSKQLEETIDKATRTFTEIAEKEKQSLYALPYLIATFEEANPLLAEDLQTTYSPEIFIQETPPEFVPQRNQFALERIEGGFQPIKEVLEKGADYAKGKVKDFAFKAIKKGGKKVIEKGAAVAAKAGITVAATAGVEVAAGPPGWVLLAAQAAKKVVSAVIKPLKKVFGKIATLLTGERDTKKQLAYLGAGLFLLGGITASMPLLAAGAGIFALSNLAAITAAAPAVMSALAGATVSAIGAPIIIAVILTPLIVAFILFIINSGAYIVPPAPSLMAGLIESQYIKVEKKADTKEISNGELPETVTYTITVTAKKGTLSNISFDNECKTIKEDSISNCTAPKPSPPSIISPVEPFEFTYINTYGSSASDSLIIDTFTVTADVEGEVTGEQAASSASVCIGDCPQNCPHVWPIGTGYLAQGAYSNSCCSHHNQEAIDIGGVNLHPVFAGHAGIARVRWSSCLGNYIEIESTCEGKAFFSQYAHLEGTSVSTGQFVSMGQEIGLSGNTGSCTSGAHLHYRFRYSDLSNPSYPNNPPYMMTPYLPKDVQRGCCNDSCSSLWCSATIP